MSSLAETYALQVGVKLDKPELQESFYPLKTDVRKAVLIHAFAGNGNFPSKIYDLFNEVVDVISPILEKHGYKLYQIGGPGEPGLKNVENLSGLTSIYQTTYLLKNCALFIGNDSMNAHIAGFHQTPSVILYGPTDKKNHGPYWKNNQKTVFLESHRLGNKRPSYSAQENPKTINFITIESVANAVFELLQFGERCPFKTFCLAENYLHQLLELYPNVVVQPNFAPQAVLHIRMDYNHDENILIQNLAIRKCGIFLDKPLSSDTLEKIKGLKPNIAYIRCKISRVFPVYHIKDLKKLGVDISFFSENLSESEAASLRLDLFDACFFDNYIPKTRENFIEEAGRYQQKTLDKNINLDNLYFRSNKFLLSKDGVFLSYAHFKNSQKIEDFNKNESKIIDDPLFWREYQHGFFYEKIEKNN